MEYGIYKYMNSVAKKRTSARPANSAAKKNVRRQPRERILLEFPSALLKRTDKAAAEVDTSRSELVRTAVEQLLDSIEKRRLETELAEAYAANAAMNLELAKDFAHVDEEGF